MFSIRSNQNTASTKKIALTGGGTLGHVMPHLALLDSMRKKGWEVFYIGSNGIESTVVPNHGLTYFTIATGKLRRYFSWENFTDLFRVLMGTVQAWVILGRERPHLIFSKGGFVSVPVAIAGWLRRIPIICHESDLTPGLANRIQTPLARLTMLTFEETANYLPGKQTKHVGLPVRDQLKKGDQKKIRDICGFDPEDPRPCVLIMGGSQGSANINSAITQALPELIKTFRIIHITGRNKATDPSGTAVSPSDLTLSYWQSEFVGDQLNHLMAAADLAITRSGANSIFELLDLRIPMLLIPLKHGSRGDQIQNASVFTKRGWAITMDEDSLTGELLLKSLKQLNKQAESIRQQQESDWKAHSPVAQVIQCLESEIQNK